MPRIVSQCVSVLLTVFIVVPIAADTSRETLAAFAGDYQGAFDTAVTPDPLDDMNTNPCRDCELHGDALKDIYLRVHIEDGRPVPSFHRSPEGPPIDLLGKYCHSELGAMSELRRETGEGRESGDRYRIYRATYPFDPGRCSRNIPRNKTPELTLSLVRNVDRGLRFARVEIDRDLRRVVSLTAKNREGERVPVQSNPNDYGKDRGEPRSYAYRDEMDNDDKLRRNTTETRYFAIPVALNGYVGANLTWWPHKILDVEAQSEEVLTRHTGLFLPVPEASPTP